MRDDNPYIMSTKATAVSVAIPSAVFGGVSQGVVNASSRSTQVSDKSSAAEHCLKSVQEAILAYEDELNGKMQSPALCQQELGELFDSVAATRDGLGSVVEEALSAGGLIPSHAVQTASDVSIASTLVSKFISKQLNTDSINSNASSLGDKDNFFANCRHLSKIFHDELGDLANKAAPYYVEGKVEGHQNTAETLAEAGITGVIGTSGIFSLGFDLVGSTLREFQQSFLDTQAHSEQEKEVYKALSECSATLSGSSITDQASLLNALNKINHLITVLSDCHYWQNSGLETSKVNVTGSRSAAKLTFLSSTPVTVALKSLVMLALTTNKSAAALSMKEAVLSEITRRAPTLASGGNVPSLNITELTAGFEQVHQALIEFINEVPEGDRVDIQSSADVLHRSTLTLSLLPSLLTGLTGLIIRESNEGSIFLQQSQLLVKQSNEVLKSGDDAGKHLDALLTAVVQIEDALAKAKEQHVSLPVLTGVSRALASGSLVGTLNSCVGILSAIKEFRTLTQALELDEARRAQIAKEQEEDQKHEANVLERLRHDQQATTQGISGRLAPALDELSSQKLLASAIHRLIQGKHSADPISVDLVQRDDLNSTGKVLVGSEHATAKTVTVNTPAFTEAALGLFSLLALETGFSTEALMHSIAKASTLLFDLSKDTHSTMDGPDQIDTFGVKTNLSAVSNAIRLLGGASAEDYNSSNSGESVSISETLLSRSLTIALIHHKAFKEALIKLTAPEADQQQESTMRAADDAVISKLAGVLQKVLDDQAHNPKLKSIHQEAASGLSGISASAITTALAVHSAIIVPTITAMRALREGTKNAAINKEEALSHAPVLNECTKGLNILRGFTRECMKQLQKEYAQKQSEQENNDSLISTHNTVQNASVSTAVFGAMQTLLLDDFIELSLSRSLALIKTEEVGGTIRNIGQAIAEEGSLNSHICVEEVSVDSHSGENMSLIHGSTALRLTLSRLGELLMEFAEEMQRVMTRQVEHEMVLNEAEKDMHELQKSLLKSAVSALHQGSRLISTVLQTTGGLSLLPVLLRDRIETLKQTIHSSDDTSRFGPVKSSRDSVKTSEIESTSAPTAFTVDLLVSGVINLVKTLSRAGVLGSDIALSLMKVAEIIFLHEQPSAALALQTRELDPINSARQIPADASVLASVSIAGLSAVGVEAGSMCSDSINRLQNRVDRMIEQLNLLDEHDEEEERNREQVTLKQYYRELLKELEIHESELETVLDKLNKGGLLLAQHHSRYEGVRKNSWEINQNIPEELKAVHDVCAVRDRFIERMFKSRDTSNGQAHKKLISFNEKIKACGASFSPKAQQEHEYLIEAIASKLAAAKNTSNAAFFAQPRCCFNQLAFMAQYKNPFQLPEAQIIHSTRLSALFQDIEDSRTARKQNRERHSVQTSIPRQVEVVELTMPSEAKVVLTTATVQP